MYLVISSEVLEHLQVFLAQVLAVAFQKDSRVSGQKRL
jgi:hypothetical protein